ncbi:VanW family protein [Sporosarcina sp. Marseille-Q4063]|uniref:VanW family protein n=1 Tax=Sporosarcina sp. Marseille-Q4063 TaxID=2810514 RepID=UPI001BAEBE2E|nr:VanW family protein [Sporosarcina sp. Marseille-Q4063]QUW22506.1 VanW family protein [Sporosarcina sp. Marseille-Q4063]
MKIKSFLPILCLVAIIFLIYQMVSPGLQASARDGSSNATIAGIEITETKKAAIQAQVASEVEKWKSNDVIVEGTTAKISVPGSYFTFDINKTVDRFIALTETPWYKFWEDTKSTQLPIEVVIDENIHELLKEAPLFYVDETVNSIMEHAQLLNAGSVEATEVELSIDNLERISFEIQDVSVDGTGIKAIAEALNDTTIVNDEQFSFLTMLGEVDEFYSEETADFVASTLYSAVLQTDLTILERHSQNAMPKYLQPGIEAKVNQARTLDFKFLNKTETPFMISASLKGGKLAVELHSFKSKYEITYYVSDKEHVKPRTIYRLSPELAMGQEKVVEEGKDGLRIQVFRKISELNSSFEDDVLVSRDFYPPKNRVVLVSSAAPVETTTNEESTDSTTDDKNSDESPSKETTNDEVKSDTEEKTGTEGKTSDKDAKADESAEYDKGGNLITSDEK